MNELRECQFCGEHEHINIIQLGWHDWKIFCEKCKCGQSHFVSSEAAIKWWNTRATDPRLLKAVEEIKKYINNSEMSSARDGAIVTLQYIYKHIPELKEK